MEKGMSPMKPRLKELKTLLVLERDADIESMSNGGNREKKNVWMMNETCSEKIHQLCQRLHFKSLSGFLNWIVFNVALFYRFTTTHKLCQ